MDTLQVTPYPSMQLPAVSREGSQAEIAEYPDGVGHLHQQEAADFNGPIFRTGVTVKHP